MVELIVLRKLLSISLASLLLISSIGITVHQHYCDNVLVATSILPHGDEDACDSDMPMKEGSCQDKHIHYSVDSPMDSFKTISGLVAPFEWLIGYTTIDIPTLSQKVSYTKFSLHNSPPIPEPNIYTRDQAFLL